MVSYFLFSEPSRFQIFEASSDFPPFCGTGLARCKVQIRQNFHVLFLVFHRKTCRFLANVYGNLSVQDGRLLVINGFITPMNGHISG